MRRFATRLVFLLAILPLLLASQSARGYVFGKNKVQYKGFDWKVLETPHFEIYFYQGEEELAKFARQVAEDSYSMLSEDLSHTLSEKVPILIYNSHNDFEQTNVILELIEESVGGFTEIYKNRVVVPYVGSYEDFRHVITHELVHAFQFDLLYGAGIGSVISRQHLYSVPLWFVEGMAEFFSLGWDSEADMIMRDAVFSDNLKSLSELGTLGGSYLVYKGGQSAVKFIADRYGRKKIGEILHQVKYRKGLEGAIRASLGMDSEELSKVWTKKLRREYWPVYADKGEASDFGRKLTDRKRDGGYFNVNPSLSPSGDRIAFLADRGGYVDIYLISSIDGRMISRLVRGERSSGFESLHLLRGGTTWSPDGKRIAFAAKAGAKDRLYIFDVEKGKVVDSYQFDLDGVFSPSWSPDGELIAFVGLKDGESDLYLVGLPDPHPVRLTDDIYDERDPSWSPDGELIAFSSDRPSPEDSVWNYGSYAIFTLERESGEINRVTHRSSNTFSPTWSPEGNRIAFVSDMDGALNLFVFDRSENTLIQLTDLVGGVFSPCWSKDGERLAFSAYEKGGWDIYVAKHPLEGESSEPDSLPSFEPPHPPFAKDTTSLKVGDYQLTFSPDWVMGGLSYSTEYGFAGQTELAFSDILGNHRIYLTSDLFQNITESNFALEYWYLPRRLNVGGVIFQLRNYYIVAPETILMQRMYGGGLLFSYPLDKFRRVDLELNAHAIQDIYYRYQGGDWIEDEEARFEGEVFLPTLSLIKDTALWGMTGPVAGTRSRLVGGKTAALTSSSLSYSYLLGDMRKYFLFGKRYTLACRLIGAGSWGENRPLFAIGGSQTLRGHGDYNYAGSKVGLLNLELRYPFVDRLSLAFPLPIELRGIRGVLFLDMGGATDELKEFKLAKIDRGWIRLEDLKAGVGLGLRMRLSFLIFKLDFAKSTDLSSLSKETYVHFSLGSDF